MGKHKRRAGIWKMVAATIVVAEVVVLSALGFALVPPTDAAILKDARAAVRQLVIYQTIRTDDHAGKTPVVLIERKIAGFCSGVMIAPEVMLTAGHCVEGDKDTSFEVGNKRATVIRSEFDEAGHDLALLHVDAGCPCALLSDSGAVRDEDAIAIGFPLPQSVYVEMVTRGHIEGVHKDRIISDVPVAPGNSGGGLFVQRHDRWALVGIVVEVVTMPGFFGGSLTTISRSVSLKAVECFIDGLKC